SPRSLINGEILGDRSLPGSRIILPARSSEKSSQMETYDGITDTKHIKNIEIVLEYRGAREPVQ
ncbi:hypothetical protein A2U01_0052667, partial [Trifolium medium]|nr:hypothetical protein [Trifolium medium]